MRTSETRRGDRANPTCHRNPALVSRAGFPFSDLLYAMRNFASDHFPAVCLCGAARCRGSVTGWKDLPVARKARLR